MTLLTRQNVAADVMEFVKAEVPPPRPRSIDLDTQLERDLRMVWEDMEAFLLRFFARFNVDHAGFDLTQYVSAPRPLFSFGDRRLTVKPLTIGMLVNAAETGRWK